MVVVVAVVLAAPGVAAAAEQTVNAEPLVGLQDGQGVRVEGTGFDPLAELGPNLTVGLCRVEVRNGPLNAAEHCQLPDAVVAPIDPSGAFATNLTVRRASTNFFGAPVDCTVGPAACLIMAIQLTDIPGPRPIPNAIWAMTDPVSFRAETFADCRDDRWQTFTNARGRPFRSRWACFRFVLFAQLFVPGRGPAWLR
jgi:hypothetical protein